MKVFCVIPAYNEEDKIERVIAAVKPLVDELVIVDDGSSDLTGEKALRAGVKVIRHDLNRGQGAALETGNQYSLKNGADIVIHFDADGQFYPSDIPAFVNALKNGYDAAIGSRFLGKESNMPMVKKRLIMPIARLVNRLLLGVKLTDPQGGFRALSRKSLNLIEIEQDGSAHCSEILYKLVQHNLSIVELPIMVRYNEFGQGILRGKGRGSGGLRILTDLIISKFSQR